MASLYVTEYAAAGVLGGNGVPVAYGPPITTQKIAFTGTAGTSAAFNTNTRLIRVTSDSISSFLISIAGTAATVADSRLALGAAEYFAVSGGQYISAIVNT